MPPRNLLLIALTIVVSLACYSVASRNRYANLFAEAIEVIDKESLKRISREDLFVSAMEGMLKDLDEHSMYISGEMYQMFDEDMRQEFGGVGVYVEMDPRSKRLTVLAPMPGTPAFEADFQPGDQIAEIDGVSVDGMDRREVVQMLRGRVAEPLEIGFDRAGELIKKIVKRAVIPVDSVHGDSRLSDGGWDFHLQEYPNIGYVRLVQFGRNTADELARALDTIGDIDGLVIDLRNNTGGLLDVAVEVCDMFLPKGKKIVTTKVRDQVVDSESFSTSLEKLDPTIPVCILVNRTSASASEVVSGCLQDHGRVTLIGEQTWGKGTVQNVIPIQRGESALKLTTASYWRPSGRSIDRYDDGVKETKIWGVQPDEGWEIELTEEDIFKNSRSRYVRELRGLLTPEQAKMVQEISLLNMQAVEARLNSENPTELPEGDSLAPHVDRPLQRAIEFMQQYIGNSMKAI
ncbi:MAG: S41 family peptidase [Mariniblastus sp.]|nr:S41 family peptidase [Mariniblastus sp.]